MLQVRAQWAVPQLRVLAGVKMAVVAVNTLVLELAKTAAVVDASGLANKNCFEGVSSLCHTLIKMKILKI